jgi:hypothetical protein
VILILVPRPPRLGPFLDDESLPNAKNFFLEYEQWWINPLLLTPPIPPQAFLSDENVLPNAKNFALEHEAWWVNPQQVFLTNRPPFLDTDERVPFVAPAQMEDDLWLRLVTWPVSPPAPAILDDETLPNAKNFFVDEDLWWLPSYRGYLLPLQAITDDEILPGAANFFLDEDLWSVSGMALGRLPLVPSTTDEDVWPTPSSGFSGEDELWLRVTIWPMLPPFPAFTDDEVLPNAANFALDEDVALASLAFSQSMVRQAIMDSDDLAPPASSIVDVEFWAVLGPMVQTWALRLPQTEDDALPGAKNFFLDEDLWWVPSYHGTTVPPLIIDAEMAYASPARLGLVDVFTVRCAKTLPLTVRCAQTKPQTVRATMTINQTSIL